MAKQQPLQEQQANFNAEKRSVVGGHLGTEKGSVILVSDPKYFRPGNAAPADLPVIQSVSPSSAYLLIRFVTLAEHLPSAAQS